MAAKKRKPAKANKAETAVPNGNGTPPIPVGTLIPQPHGGALRRGNPGNKGGGRPPEMLRIKSREVYEKWLAWADQETTPAAVCDKCGRAAYTPEPQVMNEIGKTAGRFGFPPEDSISRQAVREILQRQVEVITTTLKSEDADRLLTALHPVWFPS